MGYAIGDSLIGGRVLHHALGLLHNTDNQSSFGTLADWSRPQYPDSHSDFAGSGSTVNPWSRLLYGLPDFIEVYSDTKRVDELNYKNSRHSDDKRYEFERFKRNEQGKIEEFENAKALLDSPAVYAGLPAYIHWLYAAHDRSDKDKITIPFTEWVQSYTLPKDERFHWYAGNRWMLSMPQLQTIIKERQIHRQNSNSTLRFLQAYYEFLLGIEDPNDPKNSIDNRTPLHGRKLSNFLNNIRKEHELGGMEFILAYEPDGVRHYRSGFIFTSYEQLDGIAKLPEFKKESAQAHKELSNLFLASYGSTELARFNNFHEEGIAWEPLTWKARKAQPGDHGKKSQSITDGYGNTLKIKERNGTLAVSGRFQEPPELPKVEESIKLVPFICWSQAEEGPHFHVNDQEVADVIPEFPDMKRREIILPDGSIRTEILSPLLGYIYIWLANADLTERVPSEMKMRIKGWETYRKGDDEVRIQPIQQAQIPLLLLFPRYVNKIKAGNKISWMKDEITHDPSLTEGEQN